VVVLTNRRDLAADDVIRRVEELGTEVVRLNADELVQSSAPSWDPFLGSTLKAGAVWWRQFEIPVPDGVITIEQADQLLVERAQWRVWVSTLAERGATWINEPWAARRAEDKVVQLQLAYRLGFQVPRTILTNDVSTVRQFANAREVVVKTPAAGYFELSGGGFVFTRALSYELLSDESAWSRQPIFVQARVRGRHVRAVALGRRCFAATSSRLRWIGQPNLMESRGSDGCCPNLSRLCVFDICMH
jgi:hypothetical protein